VGSNYISLRPRGSITSSFWDIETSGQPDSAGGQGKTTAEMQTASTFVGWGPYAVWTIAEGLDYPRLLWENMPGEILTTASFPTFQGNGTQDDPYLIYTAGQLNEVGLFQLEWDKHFKLMADIDMRGSKEVWSAPIGSSAERSSTEPPFSGLFDGNGYAISNLTQPLFGHIDGPNAHVKNLRLIVSNVEADIWPSIGMLAKLLSEGTVSNCHVQGGYLRFSTHNAIGGLVGESYGIITDCGVSATVRGGRAYGVGGLVGWNRGVIARCYFAGEVSGGHWALGGLVGDNQGVISECYSTGKVKTDSMENYAGGLVGQNTNGGIISNCYATGSVTGTLADRLVSTGGLVGRNLNTISNCYSVGSVTGTTDVGGLVCNWEAGAIEESFWDIESSGQTFSDGGRGRTTAEMKTQSTFTDVGWDFAEVWGICEGTRYPRLLWQVPVVPGVDFNGDEKVDFRDFSKLAEYWLQDAALLETAPAPSGYCTVDFEYLAVFAENWLVDFRRPIEFSLFAHWKLDETEGSIAHDSAGDNYATLIGDSLWQPAGGKVDGALELDGIYDFVICHFALDPAYGPFKVLAWIKGGAPGQVIISQSGAGLGSEWLWVSPSDGKLMTSLMYPEPPLESESVITDGDWHQIGLMWDGWFRHLYVDGAEVAKDTDIVDPVPADGGLLFGAGNNLNNASFFSGLIDDILIYEGKYSP